MSDNINLKSLKLEDNFELSNIININGLEVRVKNYLPVNKKLELISTVIEQSFSDNNNFINPLKVEVFSMLNIVEYYTDIKFTEEEWENPDKTYDLLEFNKVFKDIVLNIPKIEYESLIEDLKETIQEIYKYRNSVFGILDSISQDYSALQLDATDIQNKISDPNNLTLLKDVLKKLG